MWQKIPSYSGSNEIWGLGLIGQGRRTRPGSYRKYAYKLKRSHHVLQRGAILFWKIKKRKCFFYFFILAVERAAVKRVVSLSENTRIQTRLPLVTSEPNPGEKAVKGRRYTLLGRSAARWHGCPTWAVDFCGGTEGEPLWPRFSFYNTAPLFIHFSPPGTGACQRHVLSSQDLNMFHPPAVKQKFKVGCEGGHRGCKLS